MAKRGPPIDLLWFTLAYGVATVIRFASMMLILADARPSLPPIVYAIGWAMVSAGGGWVLAQGITAVRLIFAVGSLALLIIMIATLYIVPVTINAGYLLSLVAGVLNLIAAAWLFTPSLRRWFRGERSTSEIADDFA